MLRTRLILGLLPLLLLLIATGSYGLFTALELGRSFEAMLVTHARAMLATEEMKEAAVQMNNAFYAATYGSLQDARKRFAETRARFDRVLREQAMAAAGTSRAEPLEAVEHAFSAQVKTVEMLLRQGSSDPLADLRRTQAAEYATLARLQELSRRDQDTLEATRQRAERLALLTSRLLIAAMIAAVILSLYLSIRLSRSLLRPIQALTASAAALGEGNLDRDVPVVSRDELGELARAFNTMAARLRAFREATTARVLRAQRTMEAALTSSPDPVFVVGKDGHVELKNPAAEQLAAAPELAGNLPAAVQAPLAEVLATGNHYLPAGYDRVITLHLGPEDRHYLPRILAVGDALTGFGGAAILLQDVTKFRLLDDAKNNLVGTVSHELRTPLTGLRMAVYLLLEEGVGLLTAAQRDLLESARGDAERLLRILNDLLDLSHLETGAAALSRSPVGVEELLAAMAAEIKPHTDAAAQRVTVQAAAGLDTVPVDRDRIRHVFMNLLTNASKYAPAGSEIMLYAQPAENGFVKFGVRDQGPGIVAECLSRVFEKFYRVPDQVKKGAGLGLAIAREIVVAHGGSIACASAPGQGSDFYFLLPRATPS